MTRGHKLTVHDRFAIPKSGDASTPPGVNGVGKSNTTSPPWTSSHTTSKLPGRHAETLGMLYVPSYHGTKWILATLGESKPVDSNLTDAHGPLPVNVIFDRSTTMEEWTIRYCKGEKKFHETVSELNPKELVSVEREDLAVKITP